MCSSQELADLRAELAALRGDCEVLNSALSGGYQRLGKTVRGLGQRLATLDDASHFGFDIGHDLSICRFVEPRAATVEDIAEGTLARGMAEAFEAMSDAAAICKAAREKDADGAGGWYIDTEGTPMELDAAPELPAIAIGLANLSANQMVAERRERERQDTTNAGVEEALKELFVWRRPHQIYPAHGLFPQGNTLLADWPSCIPQQPGLLPHLERYVAGTFDDAWFVLAVSTVATNRQLFQRLFVSCDYMDYGMYCFQFCDVTDEEDPTVPTATEAGRARAAQPDGGKWSSVVIDSTLPMQLVDKDSDALVPTFGRTSEETALWLVYLLKAYAKWRGSYSYLQCGDTARACAELTGGRARTEHWNSARVTDESVCVLWWKLTLCTRLGMLTMCAVLPNRVESGNLERVADEEFGEMMWKDGEQVVLSAELTAGLTMEYLGVRREDGLKLIKLRNLRGKPTGVDAGAWDWGPSSSKWKDKRVRQYFSYTRMHECVSWIEAGDFAKQYNTLLTMHGWEGSRFINFTSLEACPSGQTPCHAHQYLLTFDLDPQIGSPLSIGHSFANIVAKTAALYDPPDFRDLEVGEEDEGSEYGAQGPQQAESGEEKRCKVSIFLSQPNMQTFTGKGITPKPLLLRVFRLQQRRLQAPEQRAADGVLEEDDGDGTDPDVGGAPDGGDPPPPDTTPDSNARVEYYWPEYNRVELEPVPCRDPMGNLEKTKEYSLLEQQFTFAVTQPGMYSIAVEQENPMDEIEYCLSVDHEDVSHANPTGLKRRCEFAGTHVDPQVRPDSKHEKSSGTANSQSSFTMASRSRGPSMGDMTSYTERSPSLMSGRFQ